MPAVSVNGASPPTTRRVSTPTQVKPSGAAAATPSTSSAAKGAANGATPSGATRASGAGSPSATRASEAPATKATPSSEKPPASSPSAAKAPATKTSAPSASSAPSKSPPSKGTSKPPTTAAKPSSGATDSRRSSGGAAGGAPSAGYGNSMYGMGGGANSAMGMPGGSQYGAASAMQGNGASGYGGMNSMYGAGSVAGGQGSMYGMQPGSMANGGDSMYGPGSMGGGPASMYGNGSMYGGASMGGPQGMGMSNNGSMYGMGNGSMYGMGNGSMYGMGPMGSMYGSGYGLNPMMGSMGQMGSMYGMGSIYGGYFTGSVYGGSIFGTTGSLYSNGGTFYGNSDSNSVWGSMYRGPQSFHAAYMPHFTRGVVQKRNVPGFSYTMGSNLGSVAYSSRGGSMRDGASAGSLVASRMESKNSITGPRETSAYRKAHGMDAGRGATDDSDSKAGGGKSLAEGKTRDIAVADQSILKKDAVPEPPKSPTAQKSTTEGGVPLSADQRVHTVVLVETSGSATPNVRKALNKCVVSGTNYDADEVLVNNPKIASAPLAKSQQITDMVEHMAAGHNTALLVSDDLVATASSKKVVEATLQQLFELLARVNKDGFFEVAMTMYAVKSADTHRDLMVDDAPTVATVMGMSPLTGPAVMQLQSKKMKTYVECIEAYNAAAGRAKGEKLIATMLTLKQARANGAARDVLLSGLNLFASHDGPKPFAMVCAKSSAMPLNAFRYAIGGPCVTVHAFSVSDSNGEAATPLFQDVKTVAAAQNTAPRSGNVRRFIEFTQQQLQMGKKRAESATGEEKARMERDLARLEGIVADSKLLLEKPETEDPKLYRAHHETEEDATNAANRGIEKGPGPKVATLVITDSAANRAYNIQSNTVSASGRTFPVSEVVMKASTKPDNLGSAQVTSLVERYCDGHNIALVALDGKSASGSPLKSAALPGVRQAVAAALANANCVGVRVSFALVQAEGIAMDLIKPDSKMEKLVVATSPLFGPVVDNATLHRVYAIAEFENLLATASKNSAAQWNTQSAVVISVINCFADGKDVVVSSLLASFAGDNAKVYENILKQRSPLFPLYRYAFGGGATSVFAVSLSEKDDVAVVMEALNVQGAAGTVENRAPRRGSITTFVDFTKGAITKRQDRLAAIADPKDKAKNEKILAPMIVMTNDHEKVLADPKNNYPRAYSMDAPEEVKAPEEPRSRNVAAASPKRATTPQAVPSKVDFTVPQVIAFVDREVAGGERKVALGNKDYAVDEVVRRTTTSTGTSTGGSEVMGELEKHFCTVHNCLMASVSSSTEAQSGEEPVWMFFERIVSKAIESAQPGEETRVELYVSVVTATEQLADLLSDKPLHAPVALETGTSPIYGSRVFNSTMVRISTVAQLKAAMEKVHGGTAKYMKEIHSNGAMMFGTAVLCRKTADDVTVASLSAALTGEAAAPFQEVLQRTQCQRRSLVTSGFGGPYATVSMLNIKSESTAAQPMVSTMLMLSKKQHNMAVRSGSVKKFVNYTEENMRRIKETAGDKMDARQEQKVARLQRFIDENKAVLADFETVMPAYPSEHGDRNTAASLRTPGDAATGGRLTTSSSHPEANKDGKTPNKVQAVVVVRSGDGSGAKAVEKVDDTHVSTAANGATTVAEMDDVIVRHAGDRGMPASASFDRTLNTFVQGYNVALLCCDSKEAATGAALGCATTTRVLKTMAAGSELYMAMWIARDSACKDVLNPDAAFTEVRVGNSPVFGPMPITCNLIRVNAPDEYQKPFVDACAEALSSNAIAISLIVLKTVAEDGDINLSGCFVSVTGDVSIYRRAIDAGPKSDRSFFQYAMYGSCFTTGVLSVDEAANGSEVAEAMQVFQKLRGVENRPMRTGSLRRFVNFSEEAVAGMRMKMEQATEERHRTMLEQRLSSLVKMVADSKSMLESPKDVIPRVYI